MGTTYLGIDIGSTQICAIIAEKNGDNLKILGTGVVKAQGLKKGVITNIEQASNSIKNAVEEAKRVSGTHYERVLVSISGAYVKSVDSSGIVNVPNHDIGVKEINRAMRMADHNSNIPNEYEKVHVLPFMFKVDEQEFIDDPLGMNGSRLEVMVHIITAQKSALSNLKKAVKTAGINIDNIVLNGYASAIATTNDDEKELGVCVIDMGGATCNLVIHSGNSVRYNDFLAVGSSNITNDLSTVLHTPLPAAENVKIEFGSLEPSSSELIELPVLGDENKNHEVSLDIISNVLSARVEETLFILAKMLEDSGFKEQIGAGIVLTGGFTKLKGIRELATAIFNNMPVRLAKPKETDGLFETLRDPVYSVAVGLVMYGSGFFTPYELDSNKKMRHKDQRVEVQKNVNVKEEVGEIEEIESFKLDEVDESPKDKLANIRDIETSSRDESSFAKFWHRLTQLF